MHIKPIYSLVLAAAGLIAAPGLVSTAQAQSADALIDKLVDKGILSVDEAQALRDEADKDFTRTFASKTGMPEWVTALKMNGDFRARYEGIYQHANTGAGAFTEDRHRLRYRARLGFTATMTDQFEVGLRLASGDGAAGNSDPLSTNTTLDNNGSKKAVNIDLAYAKWTPRPWVALEAGKMNNAFWMTEMVFDGDYTPEGAQEKFIYVINDSHTLAFTSGQFVIDENFSGTGAAPNNDTFLFVNQVDWTAKWSPHASSRLAAGLMNFMNQRNNTVASGNATGVNTALNGTVPNITPFVARGEFTYTLESFPFFPGAFPITPMAEYANNITHDGAGNDAFNVGVAFGSAKVKKGWQVSYNYKDIGAFAVWAGLNDSDFGVRGSGGTDVRGHVIKASYKPYDPIVVNFTYIITERITLPGTAKEGQDRLQFDLVWAF
jgi:hypothetical protein